MSVVRKGSMARGIYIEKSCKSRSPQPQFSQLANGTARQKSQGKISNVQGVKSEAKGSGSRSR